MGMAKSPANSQQTVHQGKGLDLLALNLWVKVGFDCNDWISLWNARF